MCIRDSFGTGYSNLRYISEMNPDYVKIDKDFTARAMRSEKDYELFRKIIEMVHSINIKICIEGIEKEEWACAMKEIHVDYMQGYPVSYTHLDVYKRQAYVIIEPIDCMMIDGIPIA